MRILVVEDDKDVAGFVVRGLREAGHVIEHADNGRDGLFMAASESFDAVILDRMLPGGIDGLKILETLRSQKNSVPVLILSALAEVDDRVKGLKAGGDDYLTKPFAFAELLARLRALLRRGRFSFDEAVARADRVTVAVTLYALLELYKQGELDWTQDEPFGEITIEPRRGDRGYGSVAGAQRLSA